MLPARIEALIQKHGKKGCWVWLGAINNQGYGQVHFQGKTQLAHRVVIRLLTGATAPEFDHRCRNVVCVNPIHLEAVTRAENMRRAVLGGFARDNQKKTHCPRGHPYDAENTYWLNGGRWRWCRTCKRKSGRETAKRSRNKARQRALNT